MSAKAEKSEAQQEAAEAEVDSFRQGLGPFVTAAETTRMAMVFTDAKTAGNPIIFANDSFLCLTGYGREEVLGKSFNFLMKHVAEPDALAQIEATLSGGNDCVAEYRCRRKDRSEFWAATFISPVFDEGGSVVQYFASFVDLTKHKQELAHSQMLIDELNHRVKNTLSMVQSIVWQALRASSDPKLIRTAIESRLFALSRSHDLLTHENWQGVGLLDLIRQTLEPVGGRKERLEIVGENIRVPPKMALTLGIAFHELVTNAVKYGAFSNNSGSVRVAWAVERRPDGDRLALHWQEKGGPPVTAPSHRGFGSQVLEQGIAHELAGTVHLDYRAGGLVCTISIPAPHEGLHG